MLRWTSQPNQTVTSTTLFANALLAACTHDTIVKFSELVTSGLITPDNTSSAMLQLLHCPAVSVPMLDNVWRVCELEATRRHNPLRKTCVLSWASMARNMHSANSSYSLREQREHLVDKLSSIYTDATVTLDADGRMLAVMALGNLGSFSSLPLLRELIALKNNSLLRLQAMKVGRKYSESNEVKGDFPM